MAASPTAGIVSFEEARHIVEHHAAAVTPGESEPIDLISSANQILAEPISADRDFPPFPRAARDGYAVRAKDLDSVPVHLELVGEIKAGAAPEEFFQLQSGQAVAIMTGASKGIGAELAHPA